MTKAIGFLALSAYLTASAADLVIYGSSPAALAAAVQAKRMGRTAVIVSPETRIGGLTTGGLGSTDIGNKSAFGGIARAFYRDVKAHYAVRSRWTRQTPEAYFQAEQSETAADGETMWTFEPSAALRILENWERREGLDIRRGERLDRGRGGVVKREGRIVSIRCESGAEFHGDVFLDCTYEGDLMAAAGVSYAVGRESNAVYGETISGVECREALWHQLAAGIDPYVEKGNSASGLLPGVEPYDAAERDGDGDRRVQAYCFRMCLTDVPENRIPFAKPDGYDERMYELLFRNFERGVRGMPWINSAMPNRKTDTNNRTGFSTDLIGGSWNWAEASYAEREKILADHLRYQRGLMWTLANHPRVPERVRREVSRWGTCRDEFTDGLGDGWQRQLYVREARRMVGAYVMTEHNCRGDVVAPRPVALAAYGMDSHHVRRHVGADGFVHNEGDVEDYARYGRWGRQAHLRDTGKADPAGFRNPFPPYPIDYGAIVPRRDECSNLLVPVCVSSSHMAFGSIRMEPVFFALGQAAGTAAALALDAGSAVQDVDYGLLRKQLLADGQVLSFGPLAAPKVRQVMVKPRFVRGDENVRRVQPADDAAWIWLAESDGSGRPQDVRRTEEGRFVRFRNDFDSDGTPLRLDVTADERFVLYLDGKPIARGPQRGMVEHWYFHSYEIAGLDVGRHRLEAVCWVLADAAPLAQISYRGGFLLKAEGRYDASLTTGKGPWKAAPLVGTVMTKGVKRMFGVGGGCRVSGTGFPHEEPPADSWADAETVRGPIVSGKYGARAAGWMLFPADRPDQMYETRTPGRVVNVDCDLTRPFAVPAHAKLDLWWDLNEYYCAYPELAVSGGKGATVSWGWAESLVDAEGRKGNRDEWKGKSFSLPLSDVFLPDGRDNAFFTTPWFRCGRWCRLMIETSDEPLSVRRVAIGETRYPLADESSFASDDPSIDGVIGISRRAIEMCTHEMLFDCPYYEQQMYPGDSRIQLLVQDVLTRDVRMQRFVLEAFGLSQRDNGLVAMNFPSRNLQESATYTLCWIMMFADHLMWRNDADFLRGQMPNVRKALMSLANLENADGLLENLPGWSFMDWVKTGEQRFATGVAPCGSSGEGVSSLNNLQYLLALQSAAAVDEALGERHLAAHWREKADRLGRTVVARFWDDGRGILADTLAKDRFSEHAQALSILAGILDDGRRESALTALVDGKGLAPVSSYFAYFLFEAFARCGRADLVMKRFDCWRSFIAHGARTAFEIQHVDTTRSDCHGWSACPIYFLHTAIAGIKPSAPFFSRVRIAPQPSGLGRIRTNTPSPQGLIEMDLHFKDGNVRGTVVLPEPLSGEFVWNGHVRALKAGRNEIGL